MKCYVDMYLDQNLGDDLFLDCLLKKYPDIEFTVGLPSDIERLNFNFDKYKNLKISQPISIKENRAKIREFDIFILLGGSMFLNLNYKSCKMHMERALFFYYLKKKKIKTFIMGSNLGPFKTIFGKFLIKKTIQNAIYTCVRDQFSYKILKDWKIKSEYSVAPDIIFSYPYKENKILKEEKNLLGISIINTKLYPEVKEKYIDKMAKIVDEYLVKKEENKVRLLGFDGGHENDDEIVQQIFKRVKDKTRVEALTYSPKIMLNEFLDKFLECDFIICNRFHSMVLALKYRKRIYPIIYSKKTSNVLNDMGYPYEMTDYKDIEKLNIEKLLKDIENTSKIFYLEKEYIEKSELHFKALDNLKSENYL